MNDSPRAKAPAAVRPTSTGAPDAGPWFPRFLNDIKDHANWAKDAARAVNGLVAFVIGVVSTAVLAGLPWWGVVVLGILMVIGAVAHFFVTRPKRRPAVLDFVGDGPPRYFRIGPYSVRERQQYKRADGEHERIRDWLLEKGSFPRYLSSDSGAGKTSLLDAFVRPELEDRGWRVVVVRALADPEDAIRKALDPKASPEEPTTKIITTALKRRPKGQSLPGLLIVIDQFEEFLILRAEGEGAAGAADRFKNLLATLAKEDIDDLRFLIVFRKEYQADIERNDLPRLRQGENWREVDNFPQRDAVAFLMQSGLGLDEGTALSLVQGACTLDGLRGKVRPITLNMLGHVLAEGHAVPGRKIDVGRLLHDHVSRALHRSGVRVAAPALVRGLLTTVGTKRARRLSDLALEARVDEAGTRAVLLTLQAEGLVRPLGDPQDVWEVSHDFVARLLERELPRENRRWWQRGSGRPVLTDESVQRGAEAEARRELADLGIYLSRIGNGTDLQLEAGAHLNQDRLNAAPTYLRLFTSRILRASLNYNEGITDPAPLGSLTALQSLDLSGTQVVDLGPLGSLTALQSLNLSGTKVVDLGPLGSLTALQSLDLSFTQVVDLGPLGSLTALQSLVLSFTQVVDLGPLGSLTALQSLDLSSTKVVDLGPLSKVPNLEDVNAPHIEVSERKAFAKARRALGLNPVFAD